MEANTIIENGALNDIVSEDMIINLTGSADDLLQIGSPDGSTSMKATSLVWLGEKDSDEVIHICITSTNSRGQHPVFDKLLGKDINISVRVK